MKLMGKAVVPAVIISVSVLAVVFVGRRDPLAVNEEKTQPAREKLPHTTGPIGNSKTSEAVIAGNTIADARFEEFIQLTGEEIASDARNRTDLFLLLFEKVNKRTGVDRQYGYETRRNNQTIGATAA